MDVKNQPNFKVIEESEFFEYIHFINIVWGKKKQV